MQGPPVQAKKLINGRWQRVNGITCWQQGSTSRFRKIWMVTLQITQPRGMNKWLQRRLTCGRVRTPGRFSAKTVKTGPREHNWSTNSEKSECRSRSLTRLEATTMSRSRASSRRRANQKRKCSESKTSSPSSEARLNSGSQINHSQQEAKMSSIESRSWRRIWTILRRIRGLLRA